MRYFPFGKAVLFLGFAGVFVASGQVVAHAEGVPIALTYFLCGIGVVLLLPLLELRLTKVVVSRDADLLEIWRRRWWWPVSEHETHSTRGITRVVLRDRKRDCEKEEAGIDDLGSRHNWELVTETADEEIPVLPHGCASRFGGRKMGSALAVALGVPFHVEVTDAAVFP